MTTPRHSKSFARGLREMRGAFRKALTNPFASLRAPAERPPVPSEFPADFETLMAWERWLANLQHLVSEHPDREDLAMLFEHEAELMRGIVWADSVARQREDMEAIGGDLWKALQEAPEELKRREAARSGEQQREFAQR
jgi:hypothetical protein